MDPTGVFSFALPTRIVFGEGVIDRLPAELETLGVRRVMVVTDPGVAASGVLEPVTDRLAAWGGNYEIFDAVAANPRMGDVEAGARAARQTGADCLLAVGGGSPIDCAKAMAVVAPQGGAVGNYADPQRIGPEILPLVAVPTTAGTGSEVTFGAVITDETARTKFTVKGTGLAPRVALADPALTRTKPRALTAATGMDALTHAIEAYTARGAHPLSDALALGAAEMIGTHLKQAVSDGQDMAARGGMLLGSLMAGLAFSHADVGAVHCIAESMGGMFDLPHGVCNAVVLPEIMAFNRPACEVRYARIAHALGCSFGDSAEGAGRAVEAVRKLSDEIGLPPFRDLGVEPSAFADLARAAVANGSNPSNARPMDAGDYLGVLERLHADR